MNPITTHARKLIYDLLNLMPSVHQRASLKAMLALFLQARGMALPQHADHKSQSALSRFLNLYDWPTCAALYEPCADNMPSNGCSKVAKRVGGRSS